MLYLLLLSDVLTCILSTTPIFCLIFIVCPLFPDNMVNLNGFPVTIDSLTEGRCQGILSFKLDMIYFPEIIHCVAGGKKLKEMVSID